jgi:hypothetical protein
MVHREPVVSKDLPEGGPSPAPAGRRAVAAAAVALACAFVLALGLRTLTTEDLGYHLAYGDHLLDTGHIVDTSMFVDPAVMPARPRYDLPPGAWYDRDGTYRFPNANWLSQAVVAAVNRAGGMKGLSLLMAAMVAGTFALVLATMRRLGLGWAAAGAGLILAALVSYERFQLRPEVLGYLVLMGELYLLAGGPVGWRSGAGLVVLQVLLVNVHSYFLLGLGLTAAMAADAAARWLWHRRRGANGQEAAGEARRSARVLGLVLAGQVVACFVNPWGWRLAAMPVQTLVFLREHGVAASIFSDEGHPWSVIGEFFRPFAEGVFEQSKASYAFLALLGLAGAGTLAAAACRRWGHAMILAAMTAISLSMRRNIAPGALVIVPLALAAIRQAASAGGRRLGWATPAAARGGAWSLAATVAAAAVAAAGLYATFTVVTDRFYADERWPTRFGLGVSRTVVPVGPAEWINRSQPVGRLWADYNSSSNVMYFTRPHRDVPVLTNTWAYPPDVMQRVLECSRGRVPLGRGGGPDDWQVVVLRMDRTSIPLGRRLVGEPKKWSLVYLDAIHVVFLRNDGPNAELARRTAVTPTTLDVAEYVERLRRMDPVPSYSTYLGGFTLAHLGWDSQAIDVLEDVLKSYPTDPYRYRVWNMKGTCLARRGTIRMLADPPDLRGKEDWHEARNCFLESLRLVPDYHPAIANAAEVEHQIAAEKRGIRFIYPWVPVESHGRN